VIGAECPTKLFFNDNKEYANQKNNDKFLKMLADGGFQVGAFARAKYIQKFGGKIPPKKAQVNDTEDESGNENKITLDMCKIETTSGTLVFDFSNIKSPLIAVKLTKEALSKKGEICLFEAAFQHGKLLVRTDILLREKTKNIKVLEVKSKSWDSNSSLIGTRGGITSKWWDYVLDLAFQKYVVHCSLFDTPKNKKELLNEISENSTLSTFFLFLNKDAKAPDDHLHQKFKIKKTKSGYPEILTQELTPAEVESNLLIEIDASVAISKMLNQKFDLYPNDLKNKNAGKKKGKKSSSSEKEDDGGLSFNELIVHLTEIVKSEDFPTPVLGAKCKKCEFRTSEEERAQGLKSGFEECWKHVANFKAQDFKEPLIFELWNSRSLDAFITQEKFKLVDLNTKDLLSKSAKKTEELGAYGLIQDRILELAKSKKKFDINSDAISERLKGLVFPLHFVDFETARPALPFTANIAPYEEIAFQFSHHLMTADGKVKHKSQYIYSDQTKEPIREFCAEFIKAVGGEIPKNSSKNEKSLGSIIHFARHERTVIENLILVLSSGSDADNLMVQQLEAILARLVDILNILRPNYYHVDFKGSFSIKRVLPTILNNSKYIKTRYEKLKYGSEELPSLNFNKEKPMSLIQIENGVVIDPYKSLPPLLAGLATKDEEDKLEGLIFGEEINNGGAAMTAFCRMQYSNMSKDEFKATQEALLRYCELDTFAMVIVYEFLMHEVGLKIGEDTSAEKTSSKKAS
jgi:hypothetical protein